MKLNKELVMIIFLFSSSIISFVFIFIADRLFPPEEERMLNYKYFKPEPIISKKIKAGIVGISTLVMGVDLLLDYIKN